MIKIPDDVMSFDLHICLQFQFQSAFFSTLNKKYILIWRFLIRELDQRWGF